MVIACGVLYLIFFLISSNVFAKKQNYKRFLVIVMAVSVAIGCACLVAAGMGKVKGVAFAVWCAVPLICLMELEKLR